MATFDKSTRMNLPAEKMLPEVGRTGYLSSSPTKVWESDSNLPAHVRLLIINTGAATKFNVYVVDDGESPAALDLVGYQVDLDTDETMAYPDNDLWIPANAEVWVSSVASDQVLAYLMAHKYV